MPAIDFPVPSFVGETYTFNGNTWTWNGYAWILSSSGSTGPTGPTGAGVTGPTGPTGNGVTGPTGPGSSSKTFGITIDGGGAPIGTGPKGDLVIPYGMTITSWTLIADTTGSIVIDVWKDNYSTYPPTSLDSIAGSEKPTLSSQIKNQDLSLTTWSTSIVSGDIIRFNVDSASTVTRVTLSIQGNLT
jgi:hypothetical protein